METSCFVCIVRFRPHGGWGHLPFSKLRTVLLEDGLDELATAAKSTLMMPERRDSDGARNARYAGEAVPARAAKVTMPTGEVLLEPEEEAPRSRPPEEVVGLMRDPVDPEDSGLRARSEGREVPSGSVDLGMAVEPSRGSRRDLITAPSGRKIEIEEKRHFLAKARNRLLLGLLAGGLVLMLGFAYYRVLQDLPVKGAASGASAVSVQTSAASPFTTNAPTNVSANPGVPSVAATAPLGATSASGHDGPKHAPHLSPSAKGTIKPEVVPTIASAAPVPPPKPSVAPPLPTDITHNIY